MLFPGLVRLVTVFMFIPLPDLAWQSSAHYQRLGSERTYQPQDLLQARLMPFSPSTHTCRVID
jgi:hypothetical protein